MVNEFKAWGLSFPSNSVAFQYGYPDDRPWWSQLQKPPVAIGNALASTSPLFAIPLEILLLKQRPSGRFKGESHD